MTKKGVLTSPKNRSWNSAFLDFRVTPVVAALYLEAKSTRYSAFAESSRGDKAIASNTNSAYVMPEAKQALKIRDIVFFLAERHRKCILV